VSFNLEILITPSLSYSTWCSSLTTSDISVRNIKNIHGLTLPSVITSPKTIRERQQVWDVSLYLPYINHGLPHGFKEQQDFNTVGSLGKERDGAARWNVKLQLAQSG